MGTPLADAVHKIKISSGSPFWEGMPVQDSLARGGSEQDASLGLTLFERHPDAVVVVDAAGAVQRANAAAQWLAHDGVFPSLLDSVDGLSSLDTILPSQPNRHWRGPLCVRAGDGSTRAVDATLIPLTAEVRDPWYCLCVLHAERETRTHGDCAPVLLWTTGSDGLCEEWLFGVHPDDVERCLGIYRASFDAQQPFSVDYRLKQNDGSYRWMLANAVARHAADGSFEGYAGSCVDIEERKQLEDRLADRARALRLADRRKDEYLAVLAHDLRNPLAPIANAMGMLRLMERDMPALHGVRQIVERQLEQLRRLASEMSEAAHARH